MLDTDTAAFERYAALILPEVQAMSDATATALRGYRGKLLTVGETGAYDEWLEQRAAPALAGVAQQHVPEVNSMLIGAAQTGLLATDAPAAMQIGLNRNVGGYGRRTSWAYLENHSGRNI